VFLKDLDSGALTACGRPVRSIAGRIAREHDGLVERLHDDRHGCT
jgi:hypothetical protein